MYRTLRRKAFRSRGLCRPLRVESLEHRRLLAGWQNPLDNLDVDADGSIFPIDALKVINFLNSVGASPLSNPRADGDDYLDTSGDQFVSPLDAILVINELNATSARPNVFDLRETGLLVAEKIYPVALAAETEHATFSLDIDMHWGQIGKTSTSEDLLSVFVVDPQNWSRRLLGRADVGEAVFSLTRNSSQVLPGVARWNGSRLDIDLATAALQQSEVYVLVQLLNGDDNISSRATLTPNDNASFLQDPTEVLSVPFRDAPFPEGPALDVSSLREPSDLSVHLDRVAFDSTTGKYTANLTIDTREQSIGRQAVVVIEDLPAGVTVTNASGQTLDGQPYVSLSNAIPSGGLGKNTTSSPVRLELLSTNCTQFSLNTRLLVGEPNRNPEFSLPDNFTVRPGQSLTLPLQATDPDGDAISYGWTPANSMPTSTLDANGSITITPRPEEVGNYAFAVHAFDGQLKTTKTLAVTVEADSVTTTRVTGQVLNTDDLPLVGVPIELGDTVTTTDTQGRFQLESAEGFSSDALFIRGEAIVGNSVYPFIAEKLHLLFGHKLYEGVNNVIDRPIYLPALDVASGSTIDPAMDTTVQAELMDGEAPAEVFVAANSLSAQDGSPFTGVLSITEVPAERTPAALPSNLIPDVVVTIQPGEMAFGTEAPLTLPNRAGYIPGEEMDLWSINPATGDFDKVGRGRVTDDGRIVTESGGIRNSSWHFFAPPPPNPSPGPPGPCLSCKEVEELTSTVELDTGALREEHSLVPYNSAGKSRSITLHYGSLMDDPRPLVSFTYENVPSVEGPFRLAARLRVVQGRTSFQLAGAPPSFGLPGGEHFWRIPAAGGDLEASFHLDMRSRKSGIYDYELDSGFLRIENTAAGALNQTKGYFVHVNATTSPVGVGWVIEGDKQIIDDKNGRLLLLDGNHKALVFEPKEGTADQYSPSVEDFSELSRLADQTYIRVLKDQTKERFDASGRLVEIEERNGNRTAYVRHDDGRLMKIVDPVQLETTFAYEGGRLTSITDPAKRVTRLQHDVAGNLERIVDPDGATRVFEYDSQNRLVGETDPNANYEVTVYGNHGRVIGGIRKDGTKVEVVTAQGDQIYPVSKTTSFDDAPEVKLRDKSAYLIDANGGVSRTTLDEYGQAIRGSDSIGLLPASSRNDVNLITKRFDARQNITEYEYDEQGNVISMTDSVIRSQGEQLFPNQVVSIGRSQRAEFASGDLDADGFVDFVIANTEEGVAEIIFGDSAGKFERRTSMQLADPVGLPDVPDNPIRIAVFDLNNDGIQDIVANTDQTFGSAISSFVGRGDGTFEGPVISRRLWQNHYGAISHGDFDGDGTTDIIVRGQGSFLIGLGDGTGVFNAVSQPFNEHTLGSNDHVVADFNRDGLDDFAITTSRQQSEWNVVVFISTGNGNVAEEGLYALPSSPNSIAVGDLDQDGRLDLGVARRSGVSLLFGEEDGTYVTQHDTTDVTLTWANINIADTNSDGTADIILVEERLGSPAGIGTVLFGSRQRQLAESVQHFFVPMSIATTLVDVNRDGLLDAVSLTGHNIGTPNETDDTTLTLNFGLPSGSFSGPTRLFSAPFESILGVGDFNADGLPDIAFSDRQNDRVVIREGTQTGELRNAYTFEVGDEPSDLIVEDINRDGRSDLVTTNRSSNDVSVAYSLGNGAFTPQIRLPISAGRSDTGIVAGDFDGNGESDLLTGNGALFLQNDSDFTSQQTPITWSLRNAVDVADLDADGVSDVIVATSSASGDSEIRLYFGSDTGLLSQPVIVATQVGDRAAVVVDDFDNDGMPDIATLSVPSSELTVLIGKGGRAFEPRVRHSLYAHLAASRGGRAFLTTGDFNGDGMPDLAAHRSETAGTSLLFGIDNGAFQDPLHVAIGDVEQLISYGDINADGIDDILAFSDRQLFMLPGSDSADDASLNINPPTYTYDPTFNQLTTSIDELGNVTTFTVDPLNGNILEERRVVGERDSLANGEVDDIVREFTYTGLGQIDLDIDPLGRITDYDYNELGLLTRITFAQGSEQEASVEFDYDLAGNQTDRWDEKGNHTRFEFDSANRLEKVIQPDPDGPGPLESPETLYEYDHNGNLRFVTDAKGYRTERRYDALDRVFETLGSDPDGDGPLTAPITRFEFDLNGNVATTIDPLGAKTENVYDARSRLSARIDPDGGITSFRYDADGNMISLTDPVGNSTRFVYDGRDRLVAEVDPRNKITEYTYDGVNRLVQKVDRNGRVTNFDYDELGRLEKEQWLVSELDNSLRNEILYTYDKVGNLKIVEDYFSKLTHTYDSRDRVLTVDNAGTPGAPEVLLTYTYDGVGNVVSVTETLENGDTSTTAYEFDALNRTTMITQAGENVSDKRVDFSYNQLGQYESIERYSDLAGTQLVVGTNYAYDELSRLTDLEHANSSEELLAFYRYSYDADSRITQIIDIDGTTEYSYDQRDQLIGADRADDDIRGDETYRYDDNGNRLESHLHGDAYRTDAANRLSTDGIFVYEYDDEGNMTHRREIVSGIVREFQWDHRNRLVRATDKTDADVLQMEAEYVYDAINHRIEKSVDRDGAGPETERTEHYIYDRQHIAMEFVDADGAALGQRVTLDLRNLFGPGIDQMLVQDAVGVAQSRWLLTDRLGTVVEIINNSSDEQSHFIYDSYGNLLEDINDEQLRHLFAGRERDAETGLYFNRARYYDSRAAQFISEDPAGSALKALNRYEYVSNRPVDRRDPTGLVEWTGGVTSAGASYLLFRTSRFEFLVFSFA